MTTFYLKYRPQKFSDLDSSLAREELEKIFSSGKFPHAFLFSGPKGIGKTSAARIVAKAVNCEKKQAMPAGRQEAGSKNQAYEPCNECDNCKSITAGTNVDIIEIDAASNRGIDDIKELREKIKLSPAAAKYKVYIIDEIHMLTTEAFNALLKTLEEPPAHALFILCTTDPEKLPKTIVSRCQRIAFKKATKTEIISRLKKICLAEGIKFEEKALEEIVKLSEGSFRDATKILEQVALSGAVNLTEVQKTAGIFAEFGPADFLKIIQEGKTKEALLWIGRAVEAGINLKIFLESVVDQLRTALLRDFGVEQEGTVVDFTPQQARVLIKLFSRAYEELRTAVIYQLPIEMAVVEWGEISSKVQSTKHKGDEGENRCEDKSEKVDEEVGSEKEVKDPALHFSPRTSVSIEEIVSKWSEILEKVKSLNHSVQAFLRACRPIAVQDGLLTLEVFYKFHKEQLEKEQCRRIFEQTASEVLSCPVKLKCILGEKPSFAKASAGRAETLRLREEPSTISDAPKLDGADIMKIAEEIFNGTSIQ